MDNYTTAPAPRQEVSTPTETDFVLALRYFLTDWPNITQNDAADAKAVICDHYAQGQVSTSGPCVSCGTQMRYNGLCARHKGQGDSWLVRLAAKWQGRAIDRTRKKPLQFVKTSNRKGGVQSYQINGYRYSTIHPYLCAGCWNNGILPAMAAFEEKVQAASRTAFKHAQELGGKEDEAEVDCSVDYRFSLIENWRSPGPSDDLRKMPYRDFLQTAFWQTVRAKVVQDRGARCELCYSRASISVHHKTYKHHGEEQWHLEELIILCNACHAKFHDKTPSPPP